MNALGVFQIVLYLGVLVALAKPLGSFMARVYTGERTSAARILAATVIGAGVMAERLSEGQWRCSQIPRRRSPR